MGIFDFFSKRNRRFKHEFESYKKGCEDLSDYQLKMALHDMYDALFCIGTACAETGELVEELTESPFADTYKIDRFENRMNALLSVIKDRLSSKGKNGEIPSAAPAKYLDFKSRWNAVSNGNPKLAQMEAKLMGYGLALKVPEMEKFSKWRDGIGYGNNVQPPFWYWSHPFQRDFSKPERSPISKIMSIPEPDYYRHAFKTTEETVEQKNLGSKSVDVMGAAETIVGKFLTLTERPFELAENSGFKREEVLSYIQEMADSDEFAKMDYDAQCDSFKKKHLDIVKKIGEYDASMLVIIAGIMKEHKEYMPAIVEFLKESGNYDKDDHLYNHDQENAKRLADCMRRQLRGKLPKQQQSVQGTLKSANEKAASLARLGRSGSLGLRRKELPSVASLKTPRANTTKTKSSSVVKTGESR